MVCINLLYEYIQMGPGKVIKNLVKGFDRNGIKYVSNCFDGIKRHCGLLQSITNVHNKKLWEALCGPNLFILPNEWGPRCKNYQHYIVPSKWVHDLYRRFSELDHATIDVWPAGIDVDFWKKNNNTLRSNTCLIYFKGRSESELMSVLNKLSDIGVAYILLRYGCYTEQEMYDACQVCNFAIVLTGTESQGIGYMEILASEIPCYVLNQDVWTYNGISANATSVPYFDSSCGYIADANELDQIEQFICSLNAYNPRNFICANLSITKRAKQYYDLITKYNCMA